MVGNRYRVLRTIGSGAQATVSVALDTICDREVAVKILERTEQGEGVPSELRVLGRVRHPNLVQVHDVAVHQGHPCVVESLADGVDFVTWAARDRDPARVCEAAAAALRGLRYLHAAGAVHRDIKPDSIRVGDGAIGELPAARLVDFGLATFNPLAETAGTIGYAAPELLAGEPATSASDLYSLGAVMLEALLGARGEKDALLRDPRRIELPGYPLLSELLADLLDLRPERRPDSASLLEGLGAVVGRSLTVSVEELAGDYFPQPPLLSREGAFYRIERAVEQLGGGAAAAIQIVGVGKTTIARHACRCARLAGMEVIAGANTTAILRSLDMAPTHGDIDRVATGAADRILARAPALVCFDLPTGCGGEALAARLLGQLSRTIAHQDAAPRPCLLLWTGELPAALERTSLAALELLELPPLSEDDVRRAAAMMLGFTRQPWIDQLAELSGGDPRVLVELVRAQVEASLPSELEAAEAEAVALATRRLTSLPAGAKRLLATVSHAFRSVSPAMVDHLVKAGAAGRAAAVAQRDTLRQLIDRGLLAVDDDGRITVCGRVLRDVARQLLSADEQRELHHRYVEALQVAREQATASALGYHMGQAGLARQSAQALLSAHVVAEADLLRTASLLPAGDPLHKEINTRVAHLARAAGELDRALAIAKEIAASQSRADGLLLEAELLLDAGQPAAALEVLAAITSRREGLPDHPRRALLGSRARFLIGDYAGALREAEASEVDVDEELSLELENIAGLSLVYAGELEQGLDRLQRALTGARADVDRRSSLLAARLLNSIGIALQRLGKLQQASDAYAEGLELSRRVGDLRFAATGALNLGTLAHRRLDLDEALAQYRRAGELAHRGGFLTTAASAIANEGNLLLLFGDLVGAHSRLQRALEIAQQAGASTLSGHIHVYLAELVISRHDYERADEHLDQARACLSSDEAGQAALKLARGELLIEQQAFDRAAQLAAELLDRMTVDDPDRWRAHDLLARALATEDLEQAKMHLEIALALGRASADEARFSMHALLAGCYQQSGGLQEAAFHAERAEASLKQLRERTPRVYRASLDVSEKVLRARKQIEKIAPATSATGVSSDALRRLLQINQELNEQIPASALLDRILQHAIELTGAERGFVLLGRDSKTLRVACSRNVDREAVRQGIKKFSRTIARAAIDEDRPVVAANAMTDEQLGQQLSIHGLKLRAVLCVPLRAGGTIRGALYVDNRFFPGAFDASHVELMEAFSEQAGIALQTAELLQQAAEQSEKLAGAKVQLEAANSKLSAQLVRQAQQLSAVQQRLRSAEQELVRRYSAANIVGRSKRMRELYLQMDRVADSDASVFIWGESGTGKELVARAIHYHSSRADEPFVTINCGAIPESLLESELFGHVRGAFTGAIRDRLGLFEIAGKGTILLDEVGDMPPEMQVKLLRILQEGTFRRVGGERERTSRCRVLSASLHQLEALVKKGSFREDLYYRLVVIQLSVPALRDRREDIPLLVEHLLSAEQSASVSAEAMAALMDYDWPGNVRELENELKRAVVLAEEDIGIADLSPRVRKAAAAQPSTEASTSLQQAVRDFERRAITSALRKTGFNVKEAAELLGMHRVALHRKIRSLQIERPSS